MFYSYHINLNFLKKGMSQGSNSDHDKDFCHIRQCCWNKTKIIAAALANVEISHNFVCNFLTKTANLDVLPGSVLAYIVTLRFFFLTKVWFLVKRLPKLLKELICIQASAIYSQIRNSPF